MANATRNGARRTGADKGNKFANVGAAAGGFVGAMGGSFVPPINVTVNNNRNSSAGGNGGNAQSLLPAPEFNSPAQVRNYCNTLRAAGVTLSIEVAMAAEILESVLASVPDPEGRPFGSRIRARAVTANAELKGNMIEVTRSFTVEIEGAEKPALVADWITRTVYA